MLASITARVFPFWGWLRRYDSGLLRSDFVAGLTVALVLIPQSMAYAQLAGLPAYYGLYAAFLPPMIAAVFGSSRQLATGPVAVVSLMTASALERLATPGSDMYITYAIAMALLVGVFQLSLGVLKLGLVVNLLSHPVVNGFTNAAALIIATSQLSKVFGVQVDSAEHHYETVYRVIKAALEYTHWPTCFLAVLAFVIMIVLRWYNRKLPGVLIAVVITTLIAWATGFEKHRTVELSQIEVKEVQDLIASFNATIGEIDSLSRERVQLSRELDAKNAETTADLLEILPISQQIEVLSVRIGRLKETLGEIRKELRSFIFEAGVDGEGVLRLYQRSHLPSEMKKQGATWRLKVGNKILTEKSLILVGGGEVVGTIPRGLPKFKTVKIEFSKVVSLFPMAVIISLLGFMEAISIAKAMAAKTGQRLDPNQELIGQGLANIVGSFSQGYAVSGSFSRSAVNLQAGAQTGMSSVFSSAVVAVTLLFFTPLLYHLPQAVLAAVIMMAVVGLINIHGFIHAWKAQWYDGVIGILTFVCTLLFAPHLDIGIMIGVALSLVLYVLRVMKPKIALLSMHPDGTFRDSERFNLAQCKHIAVLRYNGSIFFTNVNYLEEKILDLIESMPELRHILVVGNGINELDASGLDMVSLLVDRVRERGYDISFSGLNDSVLDVMRRTYLYEKIGENNFFRNVTRAIESIFEKSHRNIAETRCPLIQVVNKYEG